MAVANSPSDLGSLISSVLKQKDWLRRLRLHQVFVFWDEVVGKEIARHAQPQVIKGSVLSLAVSDSVWLQQLQFERYHLLELLNAKLDEVEAPSVSAERPVGGGLRLTELKFTLDPSWRRYEVRTKKAPLPRGPGAEGSAIDHDQFVKFAASLNSIDDQGLRESMKRLWMAMHRSPSGGA